TCDGSALKADASGTAKCTKCGNSKYLKVSGETTECVENAAACSNGYAGKEDSKNGNKCLACTDQSNGGTTDCATCEYNTATSKIKCTKCTDSNYLKTAADGTTTCVTECGNGYFKKDNGGSDGQIKVCSPCAANCLACADETADKCTSCTADTYFLLAATGSQGKCVSCGDTTSGVPNCAKCTAPASTGGKPTCSECSDGYKLEGGKCTSSSANRSALSTGAIAGISVAAVVVVGGLVGFLCWWFVCRGKA
ncbi:Variant-specific surface protein, partial [Giardia duodenalis]